MGYARIVVRARSIRATLLLYGSAVAALLAFGCGPAEEPTATPASTATSVPAEAEPTATARPQTSEATATPRPRQEEATATPESRTSEAAARPEVTSELVSRLPDMTMDEILDKFPNKFPAEFTYDDIKRGGTFRIATTWDISKWDPRVTAAGGTAAVSNVVYMTMLKYQTGPDADPINPALVPRLAESWEFSDDALQLTFKLHEGMHWGNVDDPFQAGPEILSEDIRWVLNEYQTNSVHSGVFKTVESIETPDKYTVVLNFTEPSLWLLPNLAIKDTPIFNPHLFKADRQDREAVGPGPFVLADQAKSQFVKLRANPNYFFTDSRGGKLPYLDEVEFLITPDQATRQALIRTGRVEIGYATTGGTPREAQALLKSNPELVVVASKNTRSTRFSFQMNDPMWQDVNARRALALATDMRGITDVVFQGMTAPLPLIPYYMFLEDQPRWDDDLDALYGDYIWHHDTEKARELWKQTGYGEISDPVEFYMYYDFMGDILGLMVEDLRKIGVEIKPTNMDYSAFNGPLAKGSLPGIFWSWSPGFPEVVGTLFFRYHSSGSANRENINDPVLDELTEKLRAATTRTEQETLIPQIRERYLDQIYHFEFPLGPAVELEGYSFWQPWVKNFRHGTYSGGYYYWGQSLDKVWLDK